MKKYSKLIGTIVGAIISVGVSVGLLPAELLASSPEIIAALVTLGSAVGVFLAPKNAE